MITHWSKHHQEKKPTFLNAASQFAIRSMKSSQLLKHSYYYNLRSLRANMLLNLTLIFYLLSFNLIACDPISVNKVQGKAKSAPPDDLLKRQAEHSASHLNRLLLNLFGHNHCSANMLQSDAVLNHIYTLGTCTDCRLAIGHSGRIHASKSLTFDSKS
jgi:hypothetical protein